MLSDPTTSTVGVPRQQEVPLEEDYDFSSCQRLKKLTTHDLYRFTNHGKTLLVKLFSPQALANYQQELSCLRCTTHPALLRILHHRPAQDPTSPDPLYNSHLIVVAEASRGDLNDYLPKYGRMEEKMARSLFRQLVVALQALSELQPPLLHPNLMASSVLLDSDGTIRLCGWSQVSSRSAQQRLKEGVFACGELLVCMLTAFPPFYKKYSPTDTYFKFLSPQHIHKFWQELQKKVARSDKHFFFSTEARDLLQAIFLRKYTTFAQIASHEWTRGDVYEPTELLTLLQDNEKAKNAKTQARKEQEAANDKKRLKALHEHQLTFGLARSGHYNHVDFLKDYEQNAIRQQDMPCLEIPQGVKVESCPAFVIASIKELLRNEEGHSSAVLSGQFMLMQHRIVKVGNSVKIEMQFSEETDEEEDDLLQPQQTQERASLAIRIIFTKHNNRPFAALQVEQSNFNAYYTNLAVFFLRDRILTAGMS